jgi:hypothetical protein
MPTHRARFSAAGSAQSCSRTSPLPLRTAITSTQ